MFVSIILYFSFPAVVSVQSNIYMYFSSVVDLFLRLCVFGLNINKDYTGTRITNEILLFSKHKSNNLSTATWFSPIHPTKLGHYLLPELLHDDIGHILLDVPGLVHGAEVAGRHAHR